MYHNICWLYLFFDTQNIQQQCEWKLLNKSNNFFSLSIWGWNESFELRWKQKISIVGKVWMRLMIATIDTRWLSNSSSLIVLSSTLSRVRCGSLKFHPHRATTLHFIVKLCTDKKCKNAQNNQKRNSSIRIKLEMGISQSERLQLDWWELYSIRCDSFQRDRCLVVSWNLYEKNNTKIFFSFNLQGSWKSIQQLAATCRIVWVVELLRLAWISPS